MGIGVFEDIHQLLSRAEYSSFSLITFHLSHLNKVLFIQRICSFLGFPTIALAGIVSSGLLPFSPRVLLLWSKVSFDVSIANAFVPNANECKPTYYSPLNFTDRTIPSLQSLKRRSYSNVVSL